MAADPGMLEQMREDIGPRAGLSEIRMFGGVCFMLDGHMVGGVHGKGAIFRVGKDRHEEGLGLPGARPMSFTARPMGGMVELSPDAFARDETRSRLMEMALDFVRSLPPKGETS